MRQIDGAFAVLPSSQSTAVFAVICLLGPTLRR